LEGFSSVLVVSACSGHGFKHSPALGENLAQQVCGEEVSIQFGPE
jgi:sarcosine oxidase